MRQGWKDVQRCIGMVIRKSVVMLFLPCLVAFFESLLFFHFLKCFSFKLIWDTRKNKLLGLLSYLRGWNQSVSLESGSYNDDQFCESVVCTKETKVVCIVNSCNRLWLLNMAGVDCGSERM